MSRPSIDETMLRIALDLSARGTCLKMRVGCVLTDRRGRILSTGYNGVARGQPHCNLPAKGLTIAEAQENGMAIGDALNNGPYPFKCAGADSPPGSDLCEAVHAEQNALTWCRAPDAIHTCYLARMSPCMRCTKQLLNTGCRRIVFLEEYVREPQARALWERSGLEWTRLDALDFSRQAPPLNPTAA